MRVLLNVFLKQIKKNHLKDQDGTDYLKKHGDNNPITLDYDCKIFQCLWDEEWGRSANFDIVYNKHKIYNKLTKTEPCVFHTPGPTCSDSQVWKIINNKYHITNRSEDFYEYI